MNESNMRWAFLWGLLILFGWTASAQDGMLRDCGNNQSPAIVYLTEMQMSVRVKHIEMRSDRMGDHVNFDGLAVLELIVGKNGRVLNAKAVTAHPLVLPLLMASVAKWRFKPVMRDGVAQQTCGHLKLQVSITENQSKVEVIRP
jgi:hypothetical protein